MDNLNRATQLARGQKQPLNRASQLEHVVAGYGLGPMNDFSKGGARLPQYADSYQEPAGQFDESALIVGGLLADQIARGARQVQDPVGAVTDAGVAGAAGVAAMPDDIMRIFGRSLYGDETRASLDDAQSRDPTAALLAPFAVPLGGVGALAKAPKTVAGGAAGTAALAPSAVADGGGTSWDEQRSGLLIRQKEAFQALEGMRRDLQAAGDAKRAELEDEAETNPRSLQAKVGAKVDGNIGPETRLKIDKYIENEVKKAQRDAQQRMQSLQAEYDAMGEELKRGDDLNDPAKIREREAERIEQERLTPTRILDPEYTAKAVVGGGLTGLLAGFALKGKGVRSYNRAMDEMTTRLANLTDEAKTAIQQDPARAAMLKPSLDAVADDIRALSKKGDAHKWSPSIGAITGAEIGSWAPSVQDYLKSTGQAGDAPYDAFIESFAGGEHFPGENAIKRTVGTAIIPLLAGKGVGMAADLFKRSTPAISSEVPSTLKAIDSGQVADDAGSLVAQLENLQSTAARGRVNALDDQRNLADVESARRGAQRDAETADLASDRVAEVERAALQEFALDPQRAAALRQQAQDSYGVQMPQRNALTVQEGPRPPAASVPSQSFAQPPQTWPGGRNLSGPKPSWPKSMSLSDSPMRRVNTPAGPTQAGGATADEVSGLGQQGTAETRQALSELDASLLTIPDNIKAQLEPQIAALRGLVVQGDARAGQALNDLQNGILMMAQSQTGRFDDITNAQRQMAQQIDALGQRIPARKPPQPRQPRRGGTQKEQVEVLQATQAGQPLNARQQEILDHLQRIEAGTPGLTREQMLSLIGQRGALAVPAIAGAGAATTFEDDLAAYLQIARDMDGDGIPDPPQRPMPQQPPLNRAMQQF